VTSKITKRIDEFQGQVRKCEAKFVQSNRNNKILIPAVLVLIAIITRAHFIFKLDQLTAKIMKPGAVALEKYISSDLRSKVRRHRFI